MLKPVLVVTLEPLSNQMVFALHALTIAKHALTREIYVRAVMLDFIYFLKNIYVLLHVLMVIMLMLSHKNAWHALLIARLAMAQILINA